MALLLSSKTLASRHALAAIDTKLPLGHGWRPTRRRIQQGVAATIAWGLLLLGVPRSATPSEGESQDKRVILVVAAKIKDLPDDHYLWAAEMATARLKGETEVLPGDFAAALKYARENKGRVSGIVEIMVDVYTLREEVRITCYDPKGKQLWKEKAVANMGGSEEALARKMVERALGKVDKRPACGGAR